MILGVGIDIIEVSRVAEKLKNVDFQEKVFSKNEIALCESKSTCSEHFAARFAAKEAFLKATGKGLLLGYDLRDIEVIQNEDGKPFIELHNHFKELAFDYSWNKIHLSLSHLKETACAVVIIES